jgi:excisionase family DNA binding protein
MPHNTTDRLIDTRHLCELTSLSRETVRNLAHRGVIPFVRLSPRGKLLFPMQEALEVLRRPQPTPAAG